VPAVPPSGQHAGPATDGKPRIDVTASERSVGWAAGALIGTPGDLNRFLVALLGGRLLEPAQIAEMARTWTRRTSTRWRGSWYGLGIATFRLSCVGFAWTHGGIAPGT
jgi:D-alanyl-D-alanine carboxypeptidase